MSECVFRFKKSVFLRRKQLNERNGKENEGSTSTSNT